MQNTNNQFQLQLLLNKLSKTAEESNVQNTDTTVSNEGCHTTMSLRKCMNHIGTILGIVGGSLESP